MRTIKLTAITASTVLAASLLCAGDPEFRRLELSDGAALSYAIVFPEGFEARRPHPVLLALPSGAQTREAVDDGLSRYWGRQAADLGWVVVSPVAPDGRKFHTGGARWIPGLLDAIESEVRVEGGGFHVAGAGNGGIAAFRVALRHPERFRSLTVLPGFPSSRSERQRLDRLRGMPVSIFVGGEDLGWRREVERAAELLKQAGVDTRVRILKGEGHVPPSLGGGAVMAYLDGLRKSEAPSDP